MLHHRPRTDHELTRCTIPTRRPRTVAQPSQCRSHECSRTAHRNIVHNPVVVVNARWPSKVSPLLAAEGPTGLSAPRATTLNVGSSFGTERYFATCARLRVDAPYLGASGAFQQVTGKSPIFFACHLLNAWIASGVGSTSTWQPFFAK